MSQKICWNNIHSAQFHGSQFCGACWMPPLTGHAHGITAGTSTCSRAPKAVSIELRPETSTAKSVEGLCNMIEYDILSQFGGLEAFPQVLTVAGLNWTSNVEIRSRIWEDHHFATARLCSAKPTYLLEGAAQVSWCSRWLETCDPLHGNPDRCWSPHWTT